MKRDQLAHILRAASKIADDIEVVVIGSQSILGSYDEDDLPDAAIGSVEADVAFWNDQENTKSDKVDGVLGEDSQFHATFGYYAQGVSISTAVLPEGWRDRLVRFENQSTAPGRGWCLEPHDLAIAKLVAWREKDLAFVRALIQAGLLDCAVLRDRAVTLDRPPTIQRRIVRWVSLFDA